jgi:hypothetical protein
MTSGATRVLLGAGILAGAGCSTLLGVDPDRYVAPGDDAGERSPDAGPKEDATLDAPSALDGGADAGAAGPWGCLSDPREVLDPALQVEVTLVVIDPAWPTSSALSTDGGSYLNPIIGDWLPKVAVRPCALLDPDCLNAPNAVLTDDAGRAEFSLTGDFTGFFDLRRSDLIPATLYPGHLLAGQPVASLFTYDFTRTQLLNLATSAGATVTLNADAGVGHALVWVYDCRDQQAPGVSIAYDNLGPRGATFYFSNGLPDFTATETDDFGLAGAVNVPAGTVKATATLVSSGAELGSASFDVRAGSLTSAWIRVRSR